MRHTAFEPKHFIEPLVRFLSRQGLTAGQARKVLQVTLNNITARSGIAMLAAHHEFQRQPLADAYHGSKMFDPPNRRRNRTDKLQEAS